MAIEAGAPTIETELLSILNTLDKELHPRPFERALTMDNSLDRDIGLDSLARVELVSRLEKRYGISLSENVMFKAETPHDLLIAIQAAEKSGVQISLASPERLVAVADQKVVEPIHAMTIIEALEWHQNTRLKIETKLLIEIHPFQTKGALENQ